MRSIWTKGHWKNRGRDHKRGKEKKKKKKIGGRRGGKRILDWDLNQTKVNEKRVTQGRKEKGTRERNQTDEENAGG